MPESIDDLKKALASQYSILRELGSGGMATVYLADDVRHSRQVAVKVMRPEIAHVLGPERFLREIETTARLQHPNILPLYDSGSVGSLLYYVMPYVDGESLRDRLNRENELPIEDAVRIGVEVANALDHAHKHGVIHRDIKPENVMLSRDGRALVADFGISRALESVGNDKLTETGMAVGTPMYMSPEQGRGENTLDGRSDMYSLGCVMYEILAGAPPFTGPNASAILARHSLDPVPPLRTVRDTVSPGLEATVTRALAKVPADRMKTARELADALANHEVMRATPVGPDASRKRERRRAVASVAIVLASMIIFVATRILDNNAPTAIAVMPFDVAPDSNEYLEVGLADAVIAKLSTIPDVQLVPLTSTVPFKAAAGTITGARQQLNAAFALRGNATLRNDSVTVNAELVDTEKGTRVWGGRFDRSADNLGEVVEGIATAIAGALEFRLTESQERAFAARFTQDATALDLYMQAEDAHVHRNLVKARDLYAQAVRQDSGFAIAQAKLAIVTSTVAWILSTDDRSEQFASAIQAADRAIELDSTLSDGYSGRGVAKFFTLDWNGAREDLEKAVAVGANNTTALNWFSGYRLAVGDIPEAIAGLERVLELDPLNIGSHSQLGFGLFMAGEHRRGVEQTQKGLAIAPDHPSLANQLAWHLAFSGRCEDAIPATEEAALLVPFTAAWTLSWTGMIFAMCGEEDRARQNLQTLIDRSSQGEKIDPGIIAGLYGWLGELDEALRYTERSVSEKWPQSVWLKVTPFAKPQRGDPRFDSLLAKLNIPR